MYKRIQTALGEKVIFYESIFWLSSLIKSSFFSPLAEF